MGLDLSVATPAGYLPQPEYVRAAEVLARSSNGKVSLTTDPREAVRDADAIYTDVWVSMGEEAETLAREEAFREFQVNDALVALAKPTVFILHDLPAHRGKEITSSVLDGPQSAAWDQAENRLHAQKAILEHLLAARGPPRRSR
jgi:ornithine carbamoyltransferase